MSELDNLIQQAKDFILNNEYEKALEALKQIVSQDPENHEMWYYLSIVHFQLTNLTESEVAINKALSMDGENTEYLIQLAYIKHKQDGAEESIKIYKRILEINSKHPAANVMLGLVASDEERYEEAVHFLETGIGDEPDADVLESLIECYLNLLELEKAGERLKQYVKYDLEGEELDKRNMLLVQYFLEKAMDTWTGSETDENGDTIFFPEDTEQIEDAEKYIEMAEDVGTSDEYLLGRIALLKEVIETKKDKSDSGSVNEEGGSDSDFENLSDNDKQAWHKLEELFSLWSEVNEENGVEYRSPASIKEIKESEKILEEINKIAPKDPGVKERYKELKEVVKGSKKSIPNYTNKFLRSFIISVAAVVVLFIIFQLSGFDAPEFAYDETDWITKTKTVLTYDGFVDGDDALKKYNVPISAGVQLKPIARIGRLWIQVETDKGDRGFVNYRDLKGSVNAVVEDDMPLYLNYNKKTFKDSLHAGDKVIIVGYQKMGKEKYEDLVKIKTSTDKTGIFPDYNLDITFEDNVPKISQNYIFPTTKENIETKVINSNLSEVENKYGPASSIITKGKIKTAYFRHIQVVMPDVKYRGVFFTLDAENKIIKYELNKKRNLNMVDDLPLARTIVEMEPFTILAMSFYEGKDFTVQWWEDFKDYSWITAIIGWIIDIIIILTMAILLFSIPRLIINPIMVLFSHTRFLANGIVLLLNFLVYGFASYAFFVWTAVLMNQGFAPLIFAIPAFLLWWYLHRMRIKYNRCPRCHTMNIAEDKGSSYRGQTKEVTWGTYDVFKGTTTTDTTITHNYDRRSKKTTKLIDHYTDHRGCIRCGYNWGVERKETKGESTKHY